MRTKARHQWSLDGRKFLGEKDVAKLRNKLRERAKQNPHKHSHVTDWFLIELGLATGLRVQEIGHLRCGDIYLGECSFVNVYRGKGGKQRTVRFNGEFKQHVRGYLDWKKRISEVCNDGKTGQ